MGLPRIFINLWQECGTLLSTVVSSSSVNTKVATESSRFISSTLVSETKGQSLDFSSRTECLKYDLT